MQTLSVFDVVELVSETLSQASAGKPTSRIAGDEIEVGSIVSCDIDDASADIWIEINGRDYRVLVTDITDERNAQRKGRGQ